MRHSLSIFVVTLLLVLSPSAWGQDALSKAKILFEKGEVQYRFGKFDEALVHYQAALEIVRRPSIVLNIAQCYRHLGQLEKARFNYQLYLSDWDRAHPGVPSPYLKDVRKHLEEIDTRLKAKAQADLENAERDKRRAHQRQAATTLPAAQPAPPVAPQAVSKPIAAYAAVAVAGAAALTTAILYGVGFSRESAAYQNYLNQKEPSLVNQAWADTQDARQLVTAGHVTGGIAVAAAAASLYLFLRRPKNDAVKDLGQASTNVEVSSLRGGTHAWGLELRGNF